MTVSWQLMSPASPGIDTVTVSVHFSYVFTLLPLTAIGWNCNQQIMTVAFTALLLLVGIVSGRTKEMVGCLLVSAMPHQSQSLLSGWARQEEAWRTKAFLSHPTHKKHGHTHSQQTQRLCLPLDVDDFWRFHAGGFTCCPIGTGGEWGGFEEEWCQWLIAFCLTSETVLSDIN